MHENNQREVLCLKTLIIEGSKVLWGAICDTVKETIGNEKTKLDQNEAKRILNISGTELCKEPLDRM